MMGSKVTINLPELIVVTDDFDVAFEIASLELSNHLEAEQVKERLHSVNELLSSNQSRVDELNVEIH